MTQEHFNCISDKDNGSTTPHPSLPIIIALAIIAAIVLLVALVILVVCCKTRRGGRKDSRQSHGLPEGIDDVDELTESKNDTVSSNQREKLQ